MRLSRSERRLKRQLRKEAAARYASSHSPEETKRHLTVMRYPSGRWSHGGANRSANIKREVQKRTLTVTLCPTCGGVSVEIAALTSLFTLCACK